MIAMIKVIQSDTFTTWLAELRDRAAVQRIELRLVRLAWGNPGGVKAVGAGISELRIDYGPGDRVYYLRRGPLIVVLLCGGDNSSQGADILRAKRLARDWKD